MISALMVRNYALHKSKNFNKTHMNHNVKTARDPVIATVSMKMKINHLSFFLFFGRENKNWSYSNEVRSIAFSPLRT